MKAISSLFEQCQQENGCRLAYLDVGKGILIIFLLFHHFHSAVRNLELPEFDYSIFTCWQYLIDVFFMPAFLLFTGYCSSFNASFKVFCGKHIKSLLVPMLISLVICEFLYTLLFNRDIHNLNYYIELVIFRSPWFIWAIWGGKLTLWLLIKCIRNKKTLSLTTFLMSVLGIVINEHGLTRNYFCYLHILVASLFICIGYCIKGLQLKSRYAIITLIVFVLVASVLNYFKPGHLPRFSGSPFTLSLIHYPICLFLSITGCFSFLYVCQRIKCNHFLTFYGKNSIVIYLYHFPVLAWLISVTTKNIYPSTNILLLFDLIIIYVAELLYCTALIVLFDNKRLRWIIGKK